MHLEPEAPVGIRRRRSYTAQYKAELVAQCLQPHVSIASIALANGLNANLLRRWVEQHKQTGQHQLAIEPRSAPSLIDNTHAGFIELQPVASPSRHEPAPNSLSAPQITVELPSSKGLVRLSWPADYADRLAVCLKVLLT